ncbi:MAG TPA: 6-bladed beta-propeller [Flammeovirgaceae bacterium]|nr:6-bladed beta-propeller [Flammeovirgaceae bacterium]
MKNHKLIFVILTGLALGGCKASDEAQQPGIAEPIEVKYIEKAKLSDLIKLDYRYLPLQTGSGQLIGAINRLIIRDSSIYIFDASLAKKGYRFDRQGRLMFSFGETGSGPGEYTLPMDMAVTDNEIAVADNNFSVLFFNKKGEFIKEITTDYWIYELIPFADQQFLVYSPTDYSPNGLEETFVLRIMSADCSRSIKGFFPYEEGLDDYNLSGHMTFYNGIYSYAKPLLGEVYAIDREMNLMPRYQFDFGDHSWPVDIRELKDDDDRLEEVRKNEEVMSVMHEFLENERYLMFQTIMTTPENKNKKLLSAEDFWWCLYKKGSKQCYAIHHIVNDMDGEVFDFPIATHRNWLISVLYPEELQANVAARTNESPDNYDGQPTDSLATTDNPVLLFFELKDNIRL